MVMKLQVRCQEGLVELINLFIYLLVYLLVSQFICLKRKWSGLRRDEVSGER
jgi:hypothetical protein